MAKASTKRLFTPQLIERLGPEKGRRVEIMDSNCPGLVLRVTEGGVRTFGVPLPRGELRAVWQAAGEIG